MIILFALYLCLEQIVLADSDCPTGTIYIEQMNQCLAVVQNGTKYGEYQAREECRQMGGDLTSIHNAFENMMIFSTVLTDHFTGNAYIGGYRRNGQWVWLDESNMTYTHWAPGQPTERDDCMQMNHLDGSWLTADCDERNIAFFCSIPYYGCPDGWTSFDGHCYLFQDLYPNLITWNDAQEKCLEVGGNLASIHTSEENKFLTNFVKPKVCDVSWIGLLWYDEYSWTDGSPVSFNMAVEAKYGLPAIYYIFPSCYKDGAAGFWDNHPMNVHKYSFLCKRKSIPKAFMPATDSRV